MIRDLSQEEVAGTFFDLMIEVEGGDQFDRTNAAHTAWLTQRIVRRFGGGAQFNGCFLDDGRPVGLVGTLLEDHPYLGGYGEIVDLGVYAGFRRQGHGSRLIAHAEGLARRAGVPRLYIATYAGAHGVIAYYGKRGYAPAAILPDVHGVGVPGRVYLLKTLSAARGDTEDRGVRHSG
jgi:GNAT superfamily N-acetyltransferase